MTNSKEILTNHIEEVTDEKDIPFSIGTLGKHCMDNAPHRHTFYEILYLTAGEGYHIIDFVPHKVEPPIFYFISPGQVHFWELTQVFDGHFVMFNEDFLVFPSSGMTTIEEVSFFHTIGESPELYLDEVQSIKITDLFRLMNNEYKIKEANRTSVLRAYLHILIAQLQRLTAGNIKRKISAPQSSIVRKFKHLVTQNFLRNLSVQDYADMMRVSSSHLGNTLKSMTGYTPAQLIHNEMILEAKRMLIHTELTVSEIGYRLNFEDPSYFSRFFKREVGMNPLQFQTEIREKYQTFAE
jgi:AraC family transcriptional regulator, transcriptional activator of pobA